MYGSETWPMKVLCKQKNV